MHSDRSLCAYWYTQHKYQRQVSYHCYHTFTSLDSLQSERFCVRTPVRETFSSKPRPDTGPGATQSYVQWLPVFFLRGGGGGRCVTLTTQPRSSPSFTPPTSSELSLHVIGRNYDIVDEGSLEQKRSCH